LELTFRVLNLVLWTHLARLRMRVIEGADAKCVECFSGPWSPLVSPRRARVECSADVCFIHASVNLYHRCVLVVNMTLFYIVPAASPGQLLSVDTLILNPLRLLLSSSTVEMLTCANMTSMMHYQQNTRLL